MAKIKTALVAIAKGEDAYIDEWIEYNQKLGFNDIFIYENEWIYSGIYRNDGNVHFIFVPDIRKNERRVLIQSKTYDEWIAKYSLSFDFAAFIDIDEFIVLKNGKTNINDFLEDYLDYESVYLRWRIFGDNFIEQYNGEKGYISRFTRCQKDLYNYVKTIVNFKKCPDPKFIQDMHNISRCDKTISVTKKSFLIYAFETINDDEIDECLEIAYINHYFPKTRKEFEMKLKRQKNWTQQSDEIFFNRMMTHWEKFHSGKYNEIEDLSALNFIKHGHFNE